MSFWIVDTSRLARSLPPSKIGTVIDGMKLHANEPPPKSAESAALSAPKLPVRLIVGKNAARAAPMLALAARKFASACMMSGRRVRRSEGTSAGISATRDCEFSGVAGGRSARSGWPSSSTSAFFACARARACAA